MVIKKNYAITVLDLEKIPEMNNIILRHGQITLQSSSHDYFDTLAIDSDKNAKDMTFFQIEAEDEADLDKKFKELTEELDQSITGYAVRDENTGEMLVFLEFVGELHIKFDNINCIKEGTFKKIDELKELKTGLGICKGYKSKFHPVEGKPIENMNSYTESIYLLCNSPENLTKLVDLMTEKIMEIDSDFEVEFKEFYGKNPKYSTDINCLNLDSSNAILRKIEKEK